MRCVLWTALLWLGCSSERPPFQPPISDEEPIFDHSIFADARLERAVRQALRQPQGGLASEELSGLQTLDAGGYEIANIEGIERLRGLDTLMLGDNAVVDIGPLAGLTRLQVLDLSNNQIADLAPLANLLLLKALNLDGNQVEDLAPLARLTRLDLLNLDGNQVRDVSVLSQLRRLRSVELSGNPLDLDQVEALRGRGMEVTFFLPGISFEDAQLEQTVRSAVRKPTEELTEADLRVITRLRLNSSVKSLEGIEQLTNLESLSFSGSTSEGELESLLPLADLRRLEILQLTTANIEDISALSQLTSLEKLNLNNNAIVDIAPLVGLVNLRELWLEINQIQDLLPLANLRRLEILYLADNAVEDLSRYYISRTMQSPGPPGGPALPTTP